MKITYIFPSRSRPEKFFNCLANINDFSDSKNYEIICALDEDDETMNNEYVKNKVLEYDNVKCFYGVSKNKISACNREVERVGGDTSIIVLQSDDMVWEEYGFDDEIRAAFEKHFPDFDGVIHFPEEKSADRTMVLTIMGIALFKQLGYLYHPLYESVYADNDLTDMAKKMGKYAFVNKRMYSHHHPIWNRSEWDELYRHSERPEVYQKDRLVYNERKSKNFGL